MTTNAVNAFANNLPANVSDYAAARRALARAATGSNMPFLKMGKDGVWVYGAEEIIVKPTEEWRVNPFTFRVGVVGWAGGSKVGEEMYILGEGTVNKAALPEILSVKQGDGWKDQLSIELVSVTNPDLVLQFATSSKGGKDAIGKLADALNSHGDDTEHPIVNCVTTFYIHQQYGKTYTPDFSIVRWEGAAKPKRKLV